MVKKEVQEKYIELQLLEQQMKQIQKQIQLIENQMVELTVAHKALDELKNIKPGTKILVPISNGIFVKSEIKDNQELIVNVGSDVTVNKDVQSAKGLIKKQTDEMKTFQEQMFSELQKLTVKALSLEKELQQMISEN